MIVDFRDGDRILGQKAIGIYRKGIEAAKAACEKVHVTTMELEGADNAAEIADQFISEALQDMGIGESREANIPTADALALRTAVSVYIGQLSKLSDKQVDLMVPVEDTNAVISQLQSLADRLAGQIEIPHTLSDDLKATVRVNDGPEMSMAEFADRAPDLLFRGKARV